MDTNTKVTHTKNVHTSKRYALKVAALRGAATKAAQSVKNALAINLLNAAVVIKVIKRVVSEEQMARVAVVDALEAAIKAAQENRRAR